MEWRRKTREEYLAEIREELAGMSGSNVPISEWAKHQEWMKANVPPSLRRELAGADQDSVPISEYLRRQQEEEAWWQNKLGPEPPPSGGTAGGPELLPEPMPLGEQAPAPYEPPPTGLPEPMPLGEQAPAPYEPPPTGLPEPMPEPGPSPSVAPTAWWREWLGAAAVGIATVVTIAVVTTRDESPGRLMSTPETSPICPTGGSARAVPCPDDIVTVATPVAATIVPSATAVPAASTTSPVTAAPSVADYVGRWVLESGLVDPKGGDVLWYAQDMTNLVINPTRAEFVIDPDGRIRSGSYSASLTGQSGCGTENWTATFNEVDGFVGENGFGGISWSGTVDLGGTACYTAPDNNGNSANFWITGDVLVMCDNPMPSPTECAPGWPKSSFRRAG